VIEFDAASACHSDVVHGGQEVGVTAEIRFDEIVGACADYAAALRDIEHALWAQDLVSPAILEMCRLRIAQMLGCAAGLEYRTPKAVTAGLDETLVASLTRWTTQPGFDSRTRVCLEYAEELLIGAQGVRDEQTRAVIAEIGEGGFLVLTYACGLFETFSPAGWAELRSYYSDEQVAELMLDLVRFRPGSKLVVAAGFELEGDQLMYN